MHTIVGEERWCSEANGAYLSYTILKQIYRADSIGIYREWTDKAEKESMRMGKICATLFDPRQVNRL